MSVCNLFLIPFLFYANANYIFGGFCCCFCCLFNFISVMFFMPTFYSFYLQNIHSPRRRTIYDSQTDKHGQETNRQTEGKCCLCIILWFLCFVRKIAKVLASIVSFRLCTITEKQCVQCINCKYCGNVKYFKR